MQIPACGDAALISLQRVKGVPRVWKVKAELREQHDLPEELPEELVRLIKPCRLWLHSSCNHQVADWAPFRCSGTVAEDQNSHDWLCSGLMRIIRWKPGQGVQGADEPYQVLPGVI